MTASSLTRTGETPPGIRKGHGTAELGPSDSTDSGSDVRGAGPELGDLDLDSDSDRLGTGERAAAGRDATSPVDNTLYDDEGNAVGGEDLADDASLDTTLQEPDDAGERIDREAPPAERDSVGNVERDTPATDPRLEDSCDRK